MEDKYNIRTDLLRLGVLLAVIAVILVGLKMYDQSSNAVGEFGANIFDGIIAR